MSDPQIHQPGRPAAPPGAVVRKPRQMPPTGIRGLMDMLAALRALTPEQRETLGFATEADLERLWGDIQSRFIALEARLAGLERRVALLEARPAPPDLSDIYARLAAVEARDSGMVTRALAQESDYALMEGDLDPQSWQSILQARSALTTLVRREHASLTASRQRLLMRVTELSRQFSRDDSDEAELRQHEQRARALGDLDARLGVKLDEIEALIGLDAAREYDVGGGWE